MNLNLLIWISYFMVIGIFLLEMGLMALIIDKERIIKYRMLLKDMILIMSISIIIVLVLLTIVDYYNPLTPYDKIVIVQGHNVTFNYTPFVGSYRLHLLELVVGVIVLDIAIWMEYNSTITDYDLERCEKGEA